MPQTSSEHNDHWDSSRNLSGHIHLRAIVGNFHKQGSTTLLCSQNCFLTGALTAASFDKIKAGIEVPTSCFLVKCYTDLLLTFFSSGNTVKCLTGVFYVFPSKIVGEAKTVGLYQEDRREHKCRGSRINYGSQCRICRKGSPEISQVFCFKSVGQIGFMSGPPW